MVAIALASDMYFYTALQKWHQGIHKAAIPKRASSPLTLVSLKGNIIFISFLTVSSGEKGFLLFLLSLLLLVM